MRVAVRQDLSNPNRWIFDFDPASPGGNGGASLLLDPSRGLVSIDGVHKNVLLPRRSTGGLLADGLRQIGMPRPAILEAYNVEPKTAGTLAAVGDGQGSLLGKMLRDTATTLGGTIVRWEPIPDGSAWHLRVHLSHP